MKKNSKKKFMEFFENCFFCQNKQIKKKKAYQFTGSIIYSIMRTCFLFTMNPVRCL